MTVQIIILTHRQTADVAIIKLETDRALFLVDFNHGRVALGPRSGGWVDRSGNNLVIPERNTNFFYERGGDDITSLELIKEHGPARNLDIKSRPIGSHQRGLVSGLVDPDNGRSRLDRLDEQASGCAFGIIED